MLTSHSTHHTLFTYHDDSGKLSVVINTVVDTDYKAVVDVLTV